MKEICRNCRIKSNQKVSASLQLRTLFTKLSKCHKLICIADNFQAGWATLLQYEYKDITSEFDNNQKLRQAENSDHALPKVTTDGVPVATAGSQQQPFHGFGKHRLFVALKTPRTFKYICYHCRSAKHYGGNTAPLFNAANHSSGQ